MASVRFICGTLDAHRTLERAIADFLHTEDSITFAACFDANGAVFEPLLGADDAIVSDSLNHASIIDGVRLCKARRYRYETRNLADLDRQVAAARKERPGQVLIVTDGVFSMDGFVADLGPICEVADRYDALVMVDDCHATGFIGPGAGRRRLPRHREGRRNRRRTRRGHRCSPRSHAEGHRHRGEAGLIAAASVCALRAAVGWWASDSCALAARGAEDNGWA